MPIKIITTYSLPKVATAVLFSIAPSPLIKSDISESPKISKIALPIIAIVTAAIILYISDQ